MIFYNIHSQLADISLKSFALQKKRQLKFENIRNTLEFQVFLSILSDV